MIEIIPGRCRSGSVAAFSSGPNVDLRWIDNANLEVTFPKDIEIHHNVSGKVLQYFDQTVTVHENPT